MPLILQQIDLNAVRQFLRNERDTSKRYFLFLSNQTDQTIQFRNLPGASSLSSESQGICVMPGQMIMVSMRELEELLTCEGVIQFLDLRQLIVFRN